MDVSLVWDIIYFIVYTPHIRVDDCSSFNVRLDHGVQSLSVSGFDDYRKPVLVCPFTRINSSKDPVPFISENSTCLVLPGDEFTLVYLYYHIITTYHVKVRSMTYNHVNKFVEQFVNIFFPTLSSNILRICLELIPVIHNCSIFSTVYTLY